MLILVGDILGVSVGHLFMAALIPGLLLGVLCIAYILVVAILAPYKAPVEVWRASCGELRCSGSYCAICWLRCS